MKLWFTCEDEKVRGPFSADELKEMISLVQLDPETLIWGRLLDNWISPSVWLEKHTDLQAKVTHIQDHRSWHFAFEGQSHGPFQWDDLITELTGIKHANEIMIWTKGMANWAPIFEFHDIMNKVGISRRLHPRVDVHGEISMKWGESIVKGELKTLSEGGFGAEGLPQLTSGESMSVDLQIYGQSQPIRVKAQVQYTSETGFIGFRFQGLSSEARNTVVQAIKTQSQGKKAA